MIWKTGACIKKVGFGASSNVYAIIGVHVILGCSKLFSVLFEKQKAPHYVQNPPKACPFQCVRQFPKNGCKCHVDVPDTQANRRLFLYIVL